MAARRSVVSVLALVASVLGALALAGCHAAPVVLSGQLTVTGTGAHPEGVPVAVYSGATNTIVAQTATAADGSYSFDADALADGSYRVRFSSADWWQGATDWSNATDVTVAKSNPVVIDETLTPAIGTVNGTVTDGTNPLPDVTVNAVNVVTGASVATATTGPDGTYTFTGLPATTYHVRFVKTGYTTRYSNSTFSLAAAPAVVVGPDQTVSGVDTTLEIESSISGIVIAGAGKSLAGITVTAFDKASGLPFASATTSDRGNFTVHGLNATGYTLLLTDPSKQMHVQVVGSTTTDPTTGAVFTPAASSDKDVGYVGMIGSGCDLTTMSSGADLAGADLHGKNLTGCPLGGANLAGANLSGADLEWTDFYQADLTGADLTGANLYETYFRGANLTDAQLVDTVLVGSPLNGFIIEDANLTGADLSGADLRHVTSGGIVGTPSALPTGWGAFGGYLVGPGANASSADLTSADLTALDLSGTDLANADLTNADLSGLNLANTSLVNAVLTGANVDGTALATATLRGVTSGGVVGTPASLPAKWVLVNGSFAGLRASLTGADLSGADLSGVDLSGVTSGGITGTPAALPPGWVLSGGYLAGPSAVLTGASLDGADLTGADLTGVVSGGITGTPSALPSPWQLAAGYLVGPHAQLQRADLSGADLSGADIHDAELYHSTLTGTNLSGANLTGVDVSLADLAGANLAGANLTGSSLVGTTISAADFTNATLDGNVSLDLHGTPTALPASWLLLNGYLFGHGARLSDDDLSGLSLTGADLAAADLSGSTLDGTDFTGANLQGANLQGASLIGTNLTGADLTGADLTGVYSGALVGTPAALPAGWSIVGGVLVASGP